MSESSRALFAHASGHGRLSIKHELYLGKCNHPDDKLDIGYGFASSAYGFRGIGVYAECDDCGSVSYNLDEPTEDEKEWYENNPVSRGWVTIIRN